MKKLFVVLLFVTSYIANGYEISFETSKIAKEKKEKKHSFERNDAKEVVIDKSSRLMWQDDASVKSVRKGLFDAKQHCYKLTLASYNNWRLPSIEELNSIADISKSSPAINRVFKNVIADYYISASPRLSDIDTIFYMGFEHGHKHKGSRKGKGYVRCVRVNK